MSYRRSYAGTDDQRAMQALVQLAPQDSLHTVDLPYRLSSWAFDFPESTQLWFDGQDQLLAWATLQTPFWTIDYALHSSAAPELHRELLQWADQQAQMVVNSPAGRPIWFINAFADQQGRMRDLEAAGYANQADVGANSWTKVFLRHQPGHDLPTVELPGGFTIRPLRGADEVPAYVQLHRSVFQSESMTEPWRARTVQRPDYREALDLVVEAPDGQLAAFCICWYAEQGPGGRPSGQIEPCGVAAAFRHRGLGRAIVAEGIRRLYRQGAADVYVETDNQRDAALKLYESVGFAKELDVWVYRRDYAAS